MAMRGVRALSQAGRGGAARSFARPQLRLLHASASLRCAAEPAPLPSGAGGEREPSEKVAGIAQQIVELNMLEVGDLHALLKERLNIPDAAPMMMGAPMAAAGAPAAGGAAVGGAEEAAPAEEQTEWEVKLTAFDSGKKIALIKEVRAGTTLGLKEAKELVEGAPKSVTKGLKKEDAEVLLKKLEAAGGTVELV